MPGRWIEWVPGVKVGPGGQRFRARFRGRSRAIKWNWEFVDRQVGPIPCCPECGATAPKGRWQARHEGWHNQLNDLLEDTIRELFGMEDSDDDDGELQLESGGENNEQ
jgi:hypothetical protein